MDNFIMNNKNNIYYNIYIPEKILIGFFYDKNKYTINNISESLLHKKVNYEDIILQNKMSKNRVCWIIAVYRAIEKRQTIIIIQKKLKLEDEFKEKITSSKLGPCSIPTLDEYLKF